MHGGNRLADRTERRPFDDLLHAVGARRDRHAFIALFEHFGPRLKAYLRFLGTDSQAAEELVQEVMLQVWNRAETFDPTRSSASTWIFAIARNKRIDAFRRESRPAIDPEDPALTPDPVELTDSALILAQSSEQLKAALLNLPPEQQELLRLAYFQERSQSEIAEELGIPLGTVKSRLRAALNRLRIAMAGLR